MKDRLIIISKKLVFDDKGDIKTGFESLYQECEIQNIGIIVITNDAPNLSVKLSNYSMCKAYSRNDVKTVLNQKRNEFGLVILGVVQQDAFLAFNYQIPLFKINDNNLSLDITIHDKVDKYGIELSNIDDLIPYINIISEDISPYLQYDFSEQYTLISLFNANTKGHQTEKNIEYKKEIQSILKYNYSTKIDKIKILKLFNFFILSEYFNNPIFQEVNYWGTFPSSEKSNDSTTIAYIKEVIRKVLNTSKSNKEILIRTKNSSKKHRSNQIIRNNNKCQSDFESLKINDYYREKLEGATVCIIDDYTTYGYSAEAAKNLLLQAGVKKLIVITLGKYGYIYNEVNYKLNGNLYKNDGYCYELISNRKHNFGPNNNNGYFERIKEIIDI